MEETFADPPLRELPVDLGELAEVMQDHTGEQSYFLDIETGDLVGILPEMGDLDADEGPDPASLPEWERDLLPIADAIRQGDPRYVLINSIDSGEVYHLMWTFTESVSDPRLADTLARALDGRGAFGRFKRTLLDAPQEEARWFALRDAWCEAQAREWLRQQGLRPVPRPPQ